MSFSNPTKRQHFYQYSFLSFSNDSQSFLLFSSASSEMQAKKSCILLTSDLYMTTSFIYSSFAREVQQVATLLACYSLILLYILHFSRSSWIFCQLFTTSLSYFFYISCNLWRQICVLETGGMDFGESQFSLLVDWNFLAVLLDIFSLIWDRRIVNFIIFILIKVQIIIENRTFGPYDLMGRLQAGICYKAQAMSDLNYNKVIPPSSNTGPKMGHLTISIDSLTFFSSSKPSCIAKIQFWGSANPIYIPIQSSETFTVIASLVKFKHYLVDSKATQIEIVDSRNYKPIAFAYLNWLTHLRPMEDKQVYVDKQDGYGRENNGTRKYFLPFYDEQVKEILPVYHYTAQNNPRKEEKLGELMVTFECRIYETQQDGYMAPNINSAANLYNVRVSEASYKKNESPSLSICQIDIPEDGNIEMRTNKTILSRHPSGLSPKIYATEYPHARRSNISILDNLGQLRKVKEQPEATEKSKTYDRMKVTGELQLQLIRMRLQMEDLVGTGKKIETISLEIVHFEPISKLLTSKDVTHLDIKCQCKEKSSHWRIFPQSQQEKTMFNSALSIKQGSLLTFIVGMKKSKDVYKGNATIDSIRDSYDVNVLSSQGSIVGYIRIKIDRKTEISIVPQALQQKNIPKQQNQKVELLPPPVKIKKIVQQINRNVQKAPQQLPKEPTIQSYFFFIIQEISPSKSRNLNYKIFDMTINDFNPQKFLFVSQREAANKPLTLTIQNNSTTIYQQTLIPILKQTPFTSYNLICSLIFQKRIQQFQINCQLYVGNLQQINYFIQSLMQPRKQSIEPQLQRMTPIMTEQSNKNSMVALKDKQTKQQKRKMKTQAIGMEQRDRRLTEQKVSGESVAMQKYQMHSQNQANDDQNIYLVDILTRFLDSMPENLLPEVEQMPKEQFLQLVGSKSTIFQLEVIDIIVSIFQENNNDMVSVTHLSQCYKAYRSFFNIYTQQRGAIIKQILELQPKATQRIRNNAQFGTLNQSMLWGRALSKVKDATLKQKINKFYKISSFGTTDSAFLLEDLQQKEKELRSLDISNLGMLIKEWVEDFIAKADLENILNLKEKLLAFGQQQSCLNIRSVGEIIQTSLELRLSLWQSLMLIQEIKGSYGCDLQLQQGIISGGSLLGWIDGVHKRSKVKSQNSRVSQSQASLDPQQLALIKQINQHHNRNNSDQFKRNSNRVSQSKSALAGNNDSDIADIANLLREKDGFLHLDMIDQTKTKQVRDRKEENEVGKEDILDEINKSQNFKIIQNKKGKEEPQVEKKLEQLPKKAKDKQIPKQMEFYLQIRQLKIYNESTQPPLLKALFLLESSSSQNQQHFYYITSRAKYSQANKQIIRYLVDRKSKTQQKGVKCILQDEQGNALMNGFLPFEEINDWFMKNQEECKRTIVMYTSNGKIGGKFAINLLLKSKEVKEDTTFEEKIQLNIESIIPQLRSMKLFARINEGQRREIMIGIDEQLTLNKPIYHCELTISDEQNTISSIISLQQLYLKGIIQQSYPLVDCNAGHFIATLSLRLTYDSRRVNDLFSGTQPKVNQQLQTNIQKEPVSGTIVFLITEVATISYKNQYTFTPKLQCLIYRRGSSQTKQKVALITPQFTLPSSELPTKYCFKQQKIQLQLQDEHSFLQFKLIENGKAISYSQKLEISLLKNGLNSNMIVLTTTGDIKANFTITFKKCELPLQKYAMRRIVDCLNDFPIDVKKDKISYLIKQAKIAHNLTFTEQNMLKEICEGNLNQNNYLIVKGETFETSFRFLVEYSDTESKLLASTLINQFLYFDVEKNKRFTGELQKKQLLQILFSLTDTMHQTILDELSQTIKHLSTKGLSTVNYLWIILILYCKGQTQSLESQQKKMLASQIDTIYQSLKMRYG